MELIDLYNHLIQCISKLEEVISTGKSGGEKLLEQNESDIDIFVFCNEVPCAEIRQNLINNLESDVSNVAISERSGRFWGVCDFVTIKNTEICLMYFSVSDMNHEIESVLSGARLDKEEGYFYPTGRCATFLSMHSLYDKEGYISSMKERLSVYPQQLSVKLIHYHAAKINNDEDFNRAVSRSDILFYHSTLENALDHFLQALFAANNCFFPSRKRTLQFIEGFTRKPENCSKRLLEVLALGASTETLAQSYSIWLQLCDEFLKLVAHAK